MLTDIAITHEYKGKKSPTPLTFVMHPFRNSTGEYRDRFEVIYSGVLGAQQKKRSAHLTELELAEAYARGLIENLEIRLRLRPVGNDYPDAPPGKKVPRSCIKPGSSFERTVHAVDLSQPLSVGLRTQLERAGVRL